LREIALGGIAVGTGLNLHIDLPKKMLRHLEQRTRHRIYKAKNHFETQAGKDAVVEASGVVTEDFESVRPQEIKIRNFIDGEFVKPHRSLSCRAKLRHLSIFP